jgi:hypothetical protein
MPRDDTEDSDQRAKKTSVHRDARDSAEQPGIQSRVTLLSILIVLSCCNEGVSGNNEFTDCEISRRANHRSGLAERGQIRVCDVAISLKVSQSTRKVSSREHDYRTDGQRSKQCTLYCIHFDILRPHAIRKSSCRSEVALPFSLGLQPDRKTEKSTCDRGW